MRLQIDQPIPPARYMPARTSSAGPVMKITRVEPNTAPAEEAHHQERRHHQFPQRDLMPLQFHPEIRPKVGEQAGDVGGAQDHAAVVGGQGVLKSAGETRQADG